MDYWDGLLKTPYYLVDETLLKQNLEILGEVSGRAGCKILLAQKAFSMFSVYPLLREYLAGSAASGLFEARLGHEEFGGETHVFSAAYREDEFDEPRMLHTGRPCDLRSLFARLQTGDDKAEPGERREV